MPRSSSSLITALLRYEILVIASSLVIGASSLESSTPTSVHEEKSTDAGCPCTRDEFKAPRWPGLIPYTRNVVIHGMSCVCERGLHGVPMRDDYRHTPGVGSHKLHTRSLGWNEARKVCNEEGGHLAIVNSLTEARVLTDMFNKSGPIKGATYPDVALLGIHDLYAEGDWVTVLGDSLAKTGYTEWTDKWGGQPDNGGGKQHCGGFLKEGGLDDVACDVPFPFFCELPTL